MPRTFPPKNSVGDGGTYSQPGVNSGTDVQFDFTASLPINSEGRYTLSASATAGNGIGDVSASSDALTLIVDWTPPVLTFTLPTRYSMTDDKDIVFINGMDTGTNVTTRLQRRVNCYNRTEFAVTANADDLSGVSQSASYAYITGPEYQPADQENITVTVDDQGNITTDPLPTGLLESVEFGWHGTTATNGLPQFRVRSINGKYTWSIHVEDRCGNVLNAEDEDVFKFWVKTSSSCVSAAYFVNQGASSMNSPTDVPSPEKCYSTAIQYIYSTFDVVEAWQDTKDDAHWLFKNLRSTTLLPESGQEADVERMNPSWTLKTTVTTTTYGGEGALSVTLRDMAGNYTRFQGQDPSGSEDDWWVAGGAACYWGPFAAEPSVFNVPPSFADTTCPFGTAA